jgi:transportin-1
MAAWVPQQAGLQEIVQTVHESTNTDLNVQREITQVTSYV